jgi:hypothetical protein
VAKAVTKPEVALVVLLSINKHNYLLLVKFCKAEGAVDRQIVCAELTVLVITGLTVISIAVFVQPPELTALIPS